MERMSVYRDMGAMRKLAGLPRRARTFTRCTQW
jgi:hypothetical protein